MSAIRIKLRGGTAAQWVIANPVLAEDEVGIERDTRKFKFGDGSTAWNALAYAGSGGGEWGDIGGDIADQADLIARLDLKLNAADFDPGDFDAAGTAAAAQSAAIAAAATDATTKANAAQAFAIQRANHTGSQAQATITNLVSDLAAKADLVGGVVPSAQIPAIAITEYLGSVASQAAMLALVGQKGDWALRSDLGTTWVITGNDPTQLADWTQLSYPTAPVTSVNGQTGAVTLGKADVGLGNVDNTSDANKPVSTAQAAADTAVLASAIQRSNHTGSQLASTISDFGDAARAVVLTGLSLISSADLSAADTILVALGKLQAQNTAQASSIASKLDSSAVSVFGLTLIDDTDQAAARSTLGLGSLATQSGTFSGTSSGNNTGDQDLSGYQPLLSLAVSTFYARSSSGAAANKSISDAALAFVAAANNGAMRTSLGLGTSAVVDTGTSGTKVPLLDAANTWSATQTMSTGKWSLTQNTGVAAYEIAVSGQPVVGIGRNSSVGGLDLYSNGGTTALWNVSGAGKLTGTSAAMVGLTSGNIAQTIDIAWARNAAGVWEANSGVAGTFRDVKLRNLLAGGGNGSYVQVPTMTVANLAAAGTAGFGALAAVSDANATTARATVAGGGANKVLVMSDGTNWLIMG